MGTVLAIVVALALQDRAPVAYRYPEDGPESFEGDFGGGAGYPGWEKLVDRTHPDFNRAERYAEPSNPSKAHTGRHVLVLRTYAGESAWKTVPGWLGGTFGFNRRPRNIPVDDGYSYHLSAWVRMPRAAKNLAHLALTWRDRNNVPLAEDRSAPLVASTEWTPLALDVPRVDRRAAYVEIKLAFGGPDVEATCWFDDVELLAMPRLIVEAPGNPYLLFEAGKDVDVLVSARLEDPQGLEMRLALGDVHGAKITQDTVIKPLSSGQVAYRVTPPAAGYYEILAELHDSTGRIARGRTPVAVLTPRTSIPMTEGTFGVTINPYSTPYDDVAALIDALGVDLVKVAVWDSATPRTGAAPLLQNLKAMLQQVWRNPARDVEIVGVLAHPPLSLFNNLDASLTKAHILETFLAPEDDWGLPLDRTLVLTRDYIRRWQLGGDFDDARWKAAVARQAFDKARDAISKRRSASTVGVSLDPGDDPATFPDAKSFSFRGTPPKSAPNVPWHVTMKVPSPPAGTDGVRWEPAVADLVKCLATMQAEVGGSGKFVLPLEALGSEGLISPDGRLTPHFVAYRTAIEMLDGAKPLAGLSLFGARAKEFIFERGGQTVAVAWAENGDIEQPLHAGRDARRVDMWGASERLVPNARVKLGATPIYVTHIDRDLLEFQSSIAWDVAEVQLRRDPTKRVLSFANTFDSDMTGVEVGVQPAGSEYWSVSPKRYGAERVVKGRVVPREVLIAPPGFSQPGLAPIEVEFRFRAGSQDYNLIVTKSLDLKALLDPVVTVTWNKAADAAQVRVDVKNTSLLERSVMLKVLLPGEKAWIEDTIYNIGAGATEIALSRTIYGAAAHAKRRAVIDVIVEERGAEQSFARRLVPLVEP